MSTTVQLSQEIDSPPADSRRWLALVIFATAQLMVVLDTSIITIALPSAQRDLHISTANRQWMITAYTLGFAGLLLLGGRMADFLGRKRMFVVGLIGFASASALGGAALNAAMLFGARALQGGFAALMAPAALSLISVTFTDPKERARAFGVYGAIAGGGAAIGLILGGALTEYASWRWCLLVNVPIALSAALGAAAVVTESRVSGHSGYDLPGTIVVTSGLVSLVYSLTKASVDGWSSSTTIVPLVLAAVLLTTFVCIERRSSDALLPLRILLDRDRGGSFLAALVSGVGLLGMFLFLSFYFQATLHYSPLEAGIAFLPFAGGVVFAAGMASSFLPRFGPRPMMFGGLLVSATGMALLTRIGVDTSYMTHVLPAEILMSVGLGFAFVPMSSTALIGVGEQDAGVASATLNTSQMVGFSLGTALLNTIFVTVVNRFVAAHSSSPATESAALVHGYSVGFAFGAVAMALSAVIALVFIRSARVHRAAATGTLEESDASKP